MMSIFTVALCPFMQLLFPQLCFLIIILLQIQHLLVTLSLDSITQNVVMHILPNLKFFTLFLDPFLHLKSKKKHFLQSRKSPAVFS